MRWSRNRSACWAEGFWTSPLLWTYKLCDYYSPIPILSPFLLHHPYMCPFWIWKIFHLLVELVLGNVWWLDLQDLSRCVQIIFPHCNVWWWNMLLFTCNVHCLKHTQVDIGPHQWRGVCEVSHTYLLGCLTYILTRVLCFTYILTRVLLGYFQKHKLYCFISCGCFLLLFTKMS